MSWAMAFHDPKRDEGTFSFYAPSNANWPHGWAKYQQAVPVFISHGTNDLKVPFEGTEDQWGWRDSLWRMAKINNGGEPTDPAEARLALSWALSQGITAALPPGDERLYRLALDVAPTCGAPRRP